MIEIRNLKGQLAELNTDTQIKIEKHNPLFNDDDHLFEDITFPFSMPLTEGNKAFFNDGHLVETGISAYRIPVTCIVAGYPFYAGVITFKLLADEYSVLLMVNFGSLANTIKSVKLSEINTGDGRSAKITEAEMKLSCQNPANYPYAYFPVYNSTWDSQKISTYPFVNNWDHAAQVFVNRAAGLRDHTAASPYFKLKHIIIKVVEYLGLQAAGPWIDDPLNDEIYIYTRYAPDLYLFGCMAYMPRSLTISDFFKLIRLRFKITLSFNLFSGQVFFQNASTLLRSNDVVDLSDYVESVTEISVSDIAGYTISLKPDETDEMFLDATNLDDKVFVATNKLIIGTGEKELEIEGSTLKAKMYADYQVPETKQQLWVSQYEGDGKSDLKFLRFKGMKSVAGGKVFPEALPIELNETDASWYRLLNDGKKIILNLNIPPSVLSTLDTSKLIAFISNQSNSHTALVESIKYTHVNEDEEFIKTVIECKTRVAEFSTPVSIEPIVTALTEDLASPKFKAFFDLNTSGLKEAAIELYYPLGRTSAGAFAPLTSSGTIKKSTDKNAGGGEILYLPVVYYDHISFGDVELRIRVGTPKYIMQNGQKRTFTQGSGYWFIKSSTFGNAFKSLDGLPVWIVF